MNFMGIKFNNQALGYLNINFLNDLIIGILSNLFADIFNISNLKFFNGVISVIFLQLEIFKSLTFFKYFNCIFVIFVFETFKITTFVNVSKLLILFEFFKFKS